MVPFIKLSVEMEPSLEIHTTPVTNGGAIDSLLHQGQLRGVVRNLTKWQEIPPHGKNPNNVVGFLTTW